MCRTGADATGYVRGQSSGDAGVYKSTGSRLSHATRPLQAGDAECVRGLLSGPGTVTERCPVVDFLAATVVSVRRVEGPAVRVPPVCAIFTGLPCRLTGRGGKTSRA